MKKIAFLFGTRPEAIKLSPLIQVFKRSGKCQVEICSTGQHKEMLDSILPLFDLKSDFELNLMTKNQTLADFTSIAIKKISKYLDQSKPDFIVVQGDTSTVFAASLVAFYQKIKIIHIEAGLRTFQKYSPFPEELNRLLTSKLADYHFAPTVIAKENLLGEGIKADRIFVTGNTGIDALHTIIENIENYKEPTLISELKKDLRFKSNKVILITGHRRENFGKGFENICESIKQASQEHSDFLFIYPVHLNPNVKDMVYGKLSNLSNVKLIPPVDYLTFIFLMYNSYLILTDSGGVQEEAPSLKKPILVMRDSTERPEGIKAGCSILVGTDVMKISNSITNLINDKKVYNRMSSVENPYGDGKASKKIYDILKQFYGEL